MSTFDETQHPRSTSGQFASKTSGEATGVALGGGESFEAVESRLAGDTFDDFATAHDQAGRVAQAGFIGVVHEERHYDEGSDVDGERDYTSNSFQVEALETEDELDDYLDRQGVAYVEGRDTQDVAESVDPYHHPYTADVEEHTVYVRRPGQG